MIVAKEPVYRHNYQKQIMKNMPNRTNGIYSGWQPQ